MYAVKHLLPARDHSKGDVSGVVFVHFSKAFDRVQHQKLMQELSGIGVKTCIAMVH